MNGVRVKKKKEKRRKEGKKWEIIKENRKW